MSRRARIAAARTAGRVCRRGRRGRPPSSATPSNTRRVAEVEREQQGPGAKAVAEDRIEEAEVTRSGGERLQLLAALRFHLSFGTCDECEPAQPQTRLVDQRRCDEPQRAAEDLQARGLQDLFRTARNLRTRRRGSAGTSRPGGSEIGGARAWERRWQRSRSGAGLVAAARIEQGRGAALLDRRTLRAGPFAQRERPPEQVRGAFEREDRGLLGRGEGVADGLCSKRRAPSRWDRTTSGSARWPSVAL